jgi:hypothetical protein
MDFVRGIYKRHGGPKMETITKKESTLKHEVGGSNVPLPTKSALLLVDQNHRTGSKIF